MPLILESKIYIAQSPRSGVVPYCLRIDQKYIYEQFFLRFSDTVWIQGAVLEVKKVSGQLSEDEKKVFGEYVVGKSIRLFYFHIPLSRYDYLCFDEESWSILRDAGIFPGEYILRVKLYKIINETRNQSADLYPYRDIDAREQW